jgi:hypothetical protein
VTPYLPTLKKLDTSRVKLGTGRNQSQIRLGTLALIGGYYGELNVKHLEKRLIPKRESE